MVQLIVRESDGLKNFCNERGMILFKNWLSAVGARGKEWMLIQRASDKHWNFIDTNGKLISKEWFEEAKEFDDNLAIVKICDKGWNFINRCGAYLCRGFYEMVRDLNYGNFAVVKKNGKYNFVNKETGKYIWHDWILKYEVSNGVVVRIQREDGLWNIVDKNLNPVSKRAYPYIGPFVSGIAMVRRNATVDCWNYITEEGKLLSETWFYKVDNFTTDYELARVQRSSDLHYNLIKRDGKVLTKKWFPYISFLIYSGWAKIMCKNGRYNYINAEARFLSKDCDFFEASDFTESGFAVIAREPKMKNIINAEGDILLPNWYEEIELHNDASAIVVNSWNDAWERIKL